MTPSDLIKAIERYRDARPALRPAMLKSATASAIALADDRDALLKRLEARWRWCGEHKDHAALNEREDAVLQDLATYEAIEDALALAADALFGEAA